jgi:hypothetical protein
MLALFVGIITIAAVGQMANQCGREPVYRVTSDGAARVTASGEIRVTNRKHLECWTK